MLHRFNPWSGLLWLLCLSLLSACSSYGTYSPDEVVPGMSQDQVVARMGQPDRERAMDEGKRLEYKRGALSKQTWFVYVDAAGKVVRTDQVMTELHFSRVNVGMSQDDVLVLLGKPSEVRTLGQDGSVVWRYRYENYSCRWFQVKLSPQQVISVSYAQPPECDGRTDRPIR